MNLIEHMFDQRDNVLGAGRAPTGSRIVPTQPLRR